MRSLALISSLAVVATIAAQQAPQRPTFRAGVRTVPVYCSVTDQLGHFVLNLTQDDFEIRDNGKPQTITFFSHESQPITAVVMLDGSASVLPVLERSIAAVESFIIRLLPGDQVRLGSFSETIQITPDFTGDRDQLLSVFRNEFNVRVGRRTRLWDAIDEAVKALDNVEGRRVVVVFSDGVDTWSTKHFDDVLGDARKRDVMVYAVALRDGSREGQQLEMSQGRDGSSRGVRQMEPRNAFEELAHDTGGGYLEVHALEDLNAPFTRVALELHSQYLLGFTPAVLDDKLHKLEVVVKRPELKAHARETYLASAAAVK